MPTQIFLLFPEDVLKRTLFGTSGFYTPNDHGFGTLVVPRPPPVVRGPSKSSQHPALAISPRPFLRGQAFALDHFPYREVDGAAADHQPRGHGILLADTVATVNRLIEQGGRPRFFEHEDVAGRGEGEADAASLVVQKKKLSVEG